jgi:hypothetical protein
MRAALAHAGERLQPSDLFFQPWNESISHTQQTMPQYSADMGRVFSRYLRSAVRSARPSGRDPADAWATMMRGGHHAENTDTGEQYWVSNDREEWWVNNGGVVVGSDTGASPAVNENWNRLVLRGQ